MPNKKPEDAPKKKPDGKGSQPKQPEQAKPAPEVGGRGGLEPTRYGDWEIGGRCIDF